MDWGYIATIFGLITSAVMFVVGRKTAAHDDGERDGKMMMKLDSICESVGKIDDRLSRLESQNGELRDRVTRIESWIDFQRNGGGNG